VCHTDHARPTDATDRDSANTANASRTATGPRSATSTGRPSRSASTPPTAARSRRYAAVVCGESFRGARATKNASTAATNCLT
jgi:hypothetical protein